MKKKVLLITLVLIAINLAIGAILYFNFGQPSGTVHKMVLGEDGYQPQDITISRGDSIEFSTSLDGPFWPASNIHPTHGIYPEFDPQKPIMENKTWSFTFNKSGEWKYHDHLAPYYTGTITVK